MCIGFGLSAADTLGDRGRLMNNRLHGRKRFGSVVKAYVWGLVGAILVILVAAAVVWPIWYMATEHTGLYTVLSLSVIALGLLYLLVVRFRRRWNEASYQETNRTP